MKLADSNLNIDLETRMRRGGDSEYITESLGVSDFTSRQVYWVKDVTLFLLTELS